MAHRPRPTRDVEVSDFYVVLRSGEHHWFKDRTLAEVFFARTPTARSLWDAGENKILRRKEHDDDETPSGTRREDRHQEDL